MKKILIVIVVLAAIWAVPSVHAKFIKLLQPALVHMGPLGDKMMEPMRKYSAKNSIKEILSGFETARVEGKELPDRSTFISWLRVHPPTDANEMDPWGHAFYMKVVGTLHTIGSAGPDGVPDTHDDISSTVTY